VSIGNLSEEAAIKNSDFKRTTVRVNVNTKLKEWFRTGANVASTFTDSNQAVDGAANTIVSIILFVLFATWVQFTLS
jgi:hypothetical protein